MTLVLVRHARAGDRDRWVDDDRLRPLDERGTAQASALPELLGDVAVRRIVSSPYLRCVQTVRPLADALGLAVEPVAELGEEHQFRDGPRCLEALLDHDAVACVHGGIEAALGIDRPFKKGAVWLFEGALDDPVVLAVRLPG